MLVIEILIQLGELKLIHLEKVEGNDYRKFTSLKVKDEQKRYVASNVGILAKAYAYYNDSIVYGIYNDATAVGLALVREYQDDNCYIFDQLMIDEKYQGNGYGKKAIELILNDLKNKNKFKNFFLCYVEGDDAAKNLYTSFGFEHTGDIEVCDDGTKEIDMCLHL